MPLLVAANAWTEILRAPEKYIVVSKNANVSEESALFSEHNGENSTFLARLTLIVPSANSVSPLKIAVAKRLIHAIHENCIVYLFV